MQDVHFPLMTISILFPVLQHLWACNSPAVSCQLSRGAVSCQGADEILRAAAQGLRLLQHLAEEAVPTTGHLALRRAGGPVCGSEEHQPHCPETVCDH